MKLTGLKQRFISRRNRRAKRRLTKKPRFFKIWAIGLLIWMVPALAIEAVLFYKSWQEPAMWMASWRYPVSILRDYEDINEYKKGGEEYLELDDLEDQWELSVGNEIDGIILGLFTGEYYNGYWCLFDLTHDCLLDEPKEDAYSASVWYKKEPETDTEDVNYVRHMIPVNKAQADFLSQFYPVDEEDGISRERLNAIGIRVMSAYIKGADFVINSYTIDGQEYEYPLAETGISVEDYRYVQFDYEANDKWNKDGAGYGVDGTYEICLETIRNDTGLIREDIREEAQKVITDYKNDLRSGNVEGADHNGYIYYAKIYHSGIMDRIKAKYRVAASVDINGTEYAAVLIYDCYYFAKQVYRKVIKIFLLVALIGSAVTFVLALLIYQRRKTNYQLYRYRSNLTDNMAQALKAPLEEIAESVDSLSRDNTKDEQYTAEISRKIESMNGLITDLLEQAKNDTVS